MSDQNLWAEVIEQILAAQEKMLEYHIKANVVVLNGRRFGKLIENIPPDFKPTLAGMAVEADYNMPDDYAFLVQYDPARRPKTDGDVLDEIRNIMWNLLLVPLDGGPPIPRKGTTRHECYRALYEIQQLLREVYGD